MIKRIYIYYKERYPIIPRIILGIILFLEIHFIILLNMGVTWSQVRLGAAEATGAFTCFAEMLISKVFPSLLKVIRSAVLQRPDTIRPSAPRPLNIWAAARLRSFLMSP